MNISFKYRFIISFVILETIFILLIVGINFFSLEDSTKQSIEDKKNSSITLMKQLVKAPMLVYDLGTLDDINKSVVGLKNVTSSFILDDKKNLLSSYNPLKEYLNFKEIIELEEKGITHITINERRYELIFDKVEFDVTLVGYVYLLLDFNDLSTLVNENKFYTITLIIIEILLSSLVAFLIGSRLTRRLNFLTEVTKKIAKEDKVTIPKTKDSSELGVLSNTLNEMQTQIFERNAKLRQFKVIFDKILEGVVLLNEKTEITYINPSFSFITQYSEEEILGQKISILKSGEHDESFYKQMWSAIASNKYWNGNITNKKKSGELYNERLSISVIEGEGNKKIYVGIFSDITEQVQHENMMKEKEKLLHQQAKMASMGEMLGNIAHQWRQPLNLISLTASSMKMSVDLKMHSDEEFKRLSDQIISSTQYLSQTIDDFRHFFKQDKEKEIDNFEHLIETTLKLVMPSFKNKDIEIYTTIEENIDISTYVNELKQALVNILNNAKDVLNHKKMRHKAIWINVQKIQKKVVITIKDNAGGIESEVMDKIFEPYFTTKHQSQGTGIGLYMTEEIIAKHLGGEIKVENQTFDYKDQRFVGACFTIILPLQ